jgi:hypothetical protein
MTGNGDSTGDAASIQAATEPRSKRVAQAARHIHRTGQYYVLNRLVDAACDGIDPMAFVRAEMARLAGED